MNKNQIKLNLNFQVISLNHFKIIKTYRYQLVREVN